MINLRKLISKFILKNSINEDNSEEEEAQQVYDDDLTKLTSKSTFERLIKFYKDDKQAEFPIAFTHKNEYFQKGRMVYKTIIKEIFGDRVQVATLEELNKTTHSTQTQQEKTATKEETVKATTKTLRQIDEEMESNIGKKGKIKNHRDLKDDKEVTIKSLVKGLGQYVITTDGNNVLYANYASVIVEEDIYNNFNLIELIDELKTRIEPPHRPDDTLHGAMIVGKDYEGTCKELRNFFEEDDKKEKWFGEHCVHQNCTFENEWDKSEPCLVYCSHEDNKQDFEGNCNERLCPKRI